MPHHLLRISSKYPFIHHEHVKTYINIKSTQKRPARSSAPQPLKYVCGVGVLWGAGGVHEQISQAHASSAICQPCLRENSFKKNYTPEVKQRT